MKLNSSKMLFLMMISLGITMTMSSTNWIMIWCGLEISLISFIPLMISKLKASSESSMKYFIMQSISSTMLMLGMLIMIMKGDYNYNFMLMTSLMIKMGVAPFHNWVLTVIEGLDYLIMIIMLTVNKIAPLTILNYFYNKMNFVIFVTIFTGAIMGLNQNSVKKVIGYSSIFNMGFILSVINMKSMWALYLTMYSMLMSMLVLMMKKNSVNFINQMVFSETNTNKLALWMNLMSMGGMPPMLGFSIKYMVIEYMINVNMTLMLSTMIMLSLVVMFYYLRMSFLSVMNNSMMNKIKMFNLKQFSSFSIMVNMSTLPILMMVKI